MTDSVLGRFWSTWTGEHRFPETRGLQRTGSTASGDRPRVLQLRWYVALWLVALAGGFAAAVVTNIAVHALTSYRPRNTLEEVFTDRSVLAIVLLSVVLAPLLEETAFRLPATRTAWAIGLGAAVLVTMLADAAGFSVVSLVGSDTNSWVRGAALVGQVALLAAVFGLLARLIVARAKPSERADQRFRQGVTITLTLTFALLHTMNFSEPTLLTALFVMPQLFVGSVLMFARIDRSWWLAVALHALNNAVTGAVAIAGRASAEVGAVLSGVFLLALFAGGAIAASALFSEHRAAKAAARLPIVPLTNSPELRRGEAAALVGALAQYGACAVPLPDEVIARHAELDRAAQEFFALPEQHKDVIAMRHGGLAWRGWFPVGAELTSGVPDRKEGIYFGREVEASAAGGRPLAGPNLWPAEPTELRPLVERHMQQMEHLGRHVLELIGEGIGAPPGSAEAILGDDPTVLFRIFHYPQSETGADPGVGEHADYGLLTMLATNGVAGLQIKTERGWLDAPAERGFLIVNVGETLTALTGGRLPAAVHRVRPVDAERRSYPFFLDPAWDYPIDAEGTTYGQFLVSKVARVFPELAAQVLNQTPSDSTSDRPYPA